MSSSTIPCIHYSGSQDRFGKTAFLAQSNLALSHLHVCWREEAETNCGHCEKCYRTLIAFELLGARERALTFPKAAFNPGDLQRVLLKSPVEFSLMEELHSHALTRNRPDIAAAIEECVTRSRLNPPAPRISRWNQFRDGLLCPAIRLRGVIRDWTALRPA